jgi:fumarate reductase flavoprotein subunit
MSNPIQFVCDVAVIGGGISGMLAAIRSAQAGRSVTVFEKSADERYLCNSRITAGIWHCCLSDVLSEPAVLEQKIRQTTGGNARADLARAVARDGIRAVRYMQSLGVRFIKGPYDYQSFMLSPPTITPQGRQWEGRGGDVMLRTFEAQLQRSGGHMLRGHRATQLLKDGSRVSGFIGERSDNTTFQVQAGAVVVADGGFQASNELLRGPISRAPEKVFQRNARSGTGDGLRMAVQAGAALSDLRGFYGHVLSVDAFGNDRLWPYNWLDYVLAAGIVVGRDGLRFSDEGQGGVDMANAIAAAQDPGSAVVIADRRIWEERGTFGLLPPNPRLIEAGATVHQASSIEELARLAGVDPAGLVQEVSGYNEAVHRDTLANLRPARSKVRFQPYPIEHGPFMAFPVCAGITYTMGGILINANAQALDTTGTPIDGLYAVGCASGGLEGGQTSGYVGGLVKSSVTGLRAAEHIVGQEVALA